MPQSALQQFAQAEDGAVTVDWVVLTGSIVFLGAMVVLGIKSGQDSIGESLDASLTEGAATLPEFDFQ